MNFRDLKKRFCKCFNDHSTSINLRNLCILNLCTNSFQKIEMPHRTHQVGNIETMWSCH